VPNNIGLPTIPGLKPEDWIPMEPDKGPPLPSFLNIYWPWYQAPEVGEVALSDLLIEPASVQKDSEVTISVVVTNAGSIMASKNLDLLIEGPVTKTRTRTVTVNPGESRRVNFRLTIGMVGDYSVSLDGLSGAFNVYTIAPPNGPPVEGAVFSYVGQIRHSYCSVPPVSEQGKNGTICSARTDYHCWEIDVKNVGDQAGECVADCFMSTHGEYWGEDWPWSPWYPDTNYEFTLLGQYGCFYDSSPYRVRQQLIQPGETKTFRGLGWAHVYAGSGAWAVKAKFDGDPGESPESKMVYCKEYG